MSTQAKSEKAKERAKSRAITKYFQEVQVAATLDPRVWPVERLQALSQLLPFKEAGTAAAVGFLTIAERYGLDPFVGQIFLMKTNQGYKAGIERDGYLAVAEKNYPDYRGFVSGVYYPGDDFHIIRDGLDVTIYHKTVRGDDREGEKPEGAYCVVYREGRPPVLIHRTYEYYSFLHGKTNWRDHPDDMLESRCIAAAFRRAFVLPDLYLKDERNDPDPQENGGTGESTKKTASKVEEMKEALRKKKEGEPEPEDASVVDECSAASCDTFAPAEELTQVTDREGEVYEGSKVCREHAAAWYIGTDDQLDVRQCMEAGCQVVELEPNLFGDKKNRTFLACEEHKSRGWVRRTVADDTPPHPAEGE